MRILQELYFQKNSIIRSQSQHTAIFPLEWASLKIWGKMNEKRIEINPLSFHTEKRFIHQYHQIPFVKWIREIQFVKLVGKETNDFERNDKVVEMLTFMIRWMHEVKEIFDFSDNWCRKERNNERTKKEGNNWRASRKEDGEMLSLIKKKIETNAV